MSTFLQWPGDQLELLGRMFVAMVLGALIGSDRELADKPAGMRTHMLVAGSASLILGLARLMVRRFEETFPEAIVGADPLRVLVAVIMGVSFLGAGTIIRRNDRRTEGLTTAASMLFSAGIGIGAALAQWYLAVGATALALGTLRGMRTLERRIARRKGKDPK